MTEPSGLFAARTGRERTPSAAALSDAAADDLAAIAAALCDAPRGFVAFVDADGRGYRVRSEATTVRRDGAIPCLARTLRAPAAVTVVDGPAAGLRGDGADRIGRDPVRFYAGAAIVVDGRAIGVVGVCDIRARPLAAAQADGLRAVARQAARLVERTVGTPCGETRALPARATAVLERLLCGDRTGLFDLHVPTGVWTVNAAEQALLANAGASAPASGGAMRAIVHPDDWSTLADAMAPHLRGHAPSYACTHRIRGADGHDRWVEHCGVIVERDVRGDPVRIVGTHVDVTAARSAATRERREAESAALALAGGRHGRWDWDVATGTVVRDAVWAAMLGREADDPAVNGGPWCAHVVPEDVPGAMAAMERHLAGASAMLDVDVRMRHRDGRALRVLVRATAVDRDTAGRVRRVVGTTTEVTAPTTDAARRDIAPHRAVTPPPVALRPTETPPGASA